VPELPLAGYRLIVASALLFMGAVAIRLTAKDLLMRSGLFSRLPGVVLDNCGERAAHQLPGTGLGVVRPVLLISVGVQKIRKQPLKMH